MSLYDLTFQDIIQKNACLRSNDVAFVTDGARHTFGDYASDVDRLASGLISLGVGHGDRLAVIAYNCYEFFLLYGAAARIGAAIVPVNWRLKPEEIRFVIEDTIPAAIFASQDFVDTLGGILDEISYDGRRIVIGKSADAFSSFGELLGSNSFTNPVNVAPDAPWIIIHTAAVQGRSRGAVLSQRNLVAGSFQVLIPMMVQAGEPYVNLLPLFHIMGLVLSMGVFQAGGPNVISRKFNPEEAVDWIEREQARLIGTVPPMLSSILDQAEATGKSLQSLRIVAGLFDHPDTVQRCQELTGARFWSGFGQTETTGYITLCPYDERPGSSGKEGPMTRMRVVDDYGKDVPVGQPGEIVVRGPITFEKYWNLEEETAYAFREGWHHTGDVGRLDEEGYLWYMKRKAEKELIKPGGENVYPAEVEKAILRHEAVLETCVFGVPDKDWGEAVKAVCVLKEGCRIQEDELIEFVGTCIAGYKKPKHVVFVDALPKEDDGNVDREKVKSMQ